MTCPPDNRTSDKIRIGERAGCVLASPLHIYGIGFGPKHIIGTVASAVVLIVGLVLYFLTKQKSVTK